MYKIIFLFSLLLVGCEYKSYSTTIPETEKALIEYIAEKEATVDGLENEILLQREAMKSLANAGDTQRAEWKSDRIESRSWFLTHEKASLERAKRRLELLNEEKEKK